MANEKRLMRVDDFEKNLCHYCNTYMSEEPCEPNECWVHDVIAQTDTVDAVEVVHGEWIMVIDENDCECIECPLCGERFYDGDNDTFDKPYNYCPNCGAKMDL